MDYLIAAGRDGVLLTYICPVMFRLWPFLPLIWLALSLVGVALLLKKANQPAWAAWVPGLGYKKLMERCFLSKMFVPWLCAIGLYILSLYLDSIVENVILAVPLMTYRLSQLAFFVMTLLLCMNVARAYGRGLLFAAGIFFFPPVFLLILGLGPFQYLDTPYSYKPGPSVLWHCRCGQANLLSEHFCAQCGCPQPGEEKEAQAEHSPQDVCQNQALE